MGDSHRKPLSAFTAVVMRFGSFSKTCPLVVEPQVHPDFLPDLPAPDLVHLRAWFCPKNAQRQINPRRPCKERAVKVPCSPSWETTSCDQAVGRAGQEVRRAGWTPYSSFPSGSFLTSPMEREGKVTFLKHCGSQMLKWELLRVESQLDLGQM